MKTNILYNRCAACSRNFSRFVIEVAALPTTDEKIAAPYLKFCDGKRHAVCANCSHRMRHATLKVIYSNHEGLTWAPPTPRPAPKPIECEVCEEQQAIVKVSVTDLQGVVLSFNYFCADCAGEAGAVASSEAARLALKSK